MADLPGVGLITGAASGIGRATALAFARAGCLRLTLVDLNGEGLKVTQGMILEACPDAQVKLEIGDVADEGFVEKMVSDTLFTYGQLNYAVNCAGIMDPTGSVFILPLEGHDKVMDINYRGTFVCNQIELRAMLKSEPMGGDRVPGQRGAIVNIASALGIVGGKGFTAYCASKGAVIAMTKAAAVDCGPNGIRVNCICPGLIDTPLATRNGDPATIKGLEPVVNARVPLQRYGQPREVADAAVFLCSQKASFIQGHALAVDGGYLAV